MASLILKKLVAANLLPRTLSLFHPTALTPSASRLLLSTNAPSESDDEKLDFDHIRGFYPGRFPPFLYPPWITIPASRGADNSKPYAGHTVVETDESMTFWVDLPGLGKEDVQVGVMQNTLYIKGLGAVGIGNYRKHFKFLDIPEGKGFKIKEIKAEMINGVLKLMLPKSGEEEESNNGSAATKSDEVFVIMVE